MPNIDFFATGADFIPILNYVFAESRCRVFESYSPPGQDIAEFSSIDSIESRYAIGVCAGTAPSVLLELVPPESMGLCHIRRINLDPARCGGQTFRYVISGWGLIQLYLGGVGPHGLVNSHSNHFTAARARYWEPVDGGKRGAVESWDWRKTTRVSSALNRFIRKLALYKLGSRPVLPNAAAAFETGVGLVGGFDQELLLKQHQLQSGPNKQ